MIIIASLALGNTSNIVTGFLILVYLSISPNVITQSLFYSRLQIHEVSAELSNKLHLQPEGKHILLSIEILEVSFPLHKPIIRSAPHWGRGAQHSATLKIWVTRAKNSQHNWEVQRTPSPRNVSSIQSMLSYGEVKSWNIYFLF